MLYRILFSVGAIVTFLSACRKEKSIESTPEPPTTCDYAPYTIGSAFEYLYINSNHDSGTYALNVTGDTVLSGDRYSILNDGSGEQYIRCSDGSYFLYEPGMSAPDYELEAGARLYLRDNQPVGSKWTDTINFVLSGVEQRGLLQYEIEAKNSSMTVLGKEYKDIVRVRQDAVVLVGEVPIPVGTIGTYYYARGIGYIETDSPTDTIRLKNYDIK